MRRALTALVSASIVMVSAAVTRAEIRFQAESGNQPYLFASGMVLQRDRIVPVWGTALPGASVRADFFDPASSSVLQTRSTTAAATGRWVVRFDDLPVGGPYELRFYENNAATPVVLNEVLVGDVWLASGQSNMVIRLPKTIDLPIYTELRSMGVVRWGQHASGAAYYFGAELNDFLGIPIGILNRAVPDTALAHWFAPEMASDPDPLVPPLFGGCGGDTLSFSCDDRCKN